MLVIAGVVFFVGLVIFGVLAGLTALFFNAIGVLKGNIKVLGAVIALVTTFLSAGFTVWAVVDLPKSADGESTIVNFMGEDVAEQIFSGGLPGSDLFTGTPVP